MNVTVCGLSAFHFYRMPPGLRQKSLDKLIGGCTVALDNRVGARELFQSPIYCLCERDGAVPDGAVPLFAPGGLPVGSAVEVAQGLSVTAPAATLLTMAGQVDINRLMMAMCEMCGRFSAYRPSYSMRVLHGKDAWEGGASRDEYLAREPLVRGADLRAFALDAPRSAAASTFARAAEQVVDGVSSPLEARVSLLLRAARSLGGQGLRSLEAKELGRDDAGSIRALVLEGQDGVPAVAIDCVRSRPYADERGCADASARVVDAAQTTGLEVVHVGAGNLQNAFELSVWTRYVMYRAGYDPRPKTERYRLREEELRRDVTHPWWAAFGPPR